MPIDSQERTIEVWVQYKGPVSGTDRVSRKNFLTEAFTRVAPVFAQHRADIDINESLSVWAQTVYGSIPRTEFDALASALKVKDMQLGHNAQIQVRP